MSAIKRFHLVRDQAYASAMPRHKLSNDDIWVRFWALVPRRDMSAEEAAAAEAMRARARIERGTGLGVALVRRNRLVFREEGKAGPDLEVLPGIRERQRKQRDYEVEQAKLFRQAPPPCLGVQARRAKSEALKKEILALADQHVAKRPSRAAFIAERLQITPKYVREVIKKRT